MKKGKRSERRTTKAIESKCSNEIINLYSLYSNLTSNENEECDSDFSDLIQKYYDDGVVEARYSLVF